MEKKNSIVELGDRTSTITVAPIERYTFSTRVLGATKDWKDREWWKTPPTAKIRFSKVGEWTSVWFDRFAYGEDLPEYISDEKELRRREWLVFENTLPERFRPRKITRIPATFIGFHGCRDASTRVTWLAIYPSGAIETECNGAGWFQLSNKAGAKAGYEEAEGAYTTYCDDKPENAQIEKLETRVAELEKSQSMLTRRVENLAIALATLLPKPAQNPDPKDKMVTDS